MNHAVAPPTFGRPFRTDNGMDTLTLTERSRRMGLIGSRNSKPEIAVRKEAHRLGYRYRLHRTNLPGTPDLVFVSLRKVVFVHGCFWHRHPGCGRLPKSRLDFWLPKLSENRRRDLKTQRLLKRQGWRVLVIWECQTSDATKLARRLSEFLGTVK